MKYLITDTANLFFRARHIASRNTDTWGKVGMALHLTLASNNKIVRLYGPEHCVFALEGRSWRKAFYPQYKAHRVIDNATLTDKEIEENQLFWDTYEKLTTFLTEKTNTSVIRCPVAEADDVIARFIHLHPDDEVIINSTDSDYDQLISEKVSRYNGITDELITINGIFDDKGRKVLDKKTKEHKTIGEPKFVLFEKCMRGDSTDNVFSAYPGVRTKGTKNKVGLIEAFADREKQGFTWNNLMLQRWTDHEGVEHRVLDDYERNRTLIDLNAQPDDIKTAIDDAIRQGVRTQLVPQVGVHFMRFCGKYELERLSQQAEGYARWLNMPYPGKLTT